MGICRLLIREEDYRKYTGEKGTGDNFKKKKKIGVVSRFFRFWKEQWLTPRNEFDLDQQLKGIWNKKTSTNRERGKKIPGKGKCAQKLKQNRIDFLEKIPWLL